MNIDDLRRVEECFDCGCLYREYDYDNKCLVTEFICSRCRRTKEEIKKVKEPECLCCKGTCDCEYDCSHVHDINEEDEEYENSNK